MNLEKLVITTLAILIGLSCSQNNKMNNLNQPSDKSEITAKDILGNPKYLAICYEGYRQTSREIQPTVEQLKEDLKILAAMGIKIVRTYNVQLPHASNLLKAIDELMNSNPEFEMYVMLGAWIDCKNAWTKNAPDHDIESEQNEEEIERAVALVKQYPHIIKIVAVGNEAMVKWAASYYVQPSVILKWVTNLQSRKASGELPRELWITSSDDFSSWGGGDTSYHTKDLEALVKAVDYISMHTYPYHNTHYSPDFWKVPRGESSLTVLQQTQAAMVRSKDFAQKQYEAVSFYLKSIGIDKPIHIGETGWATVSDGFYGSEGSQATDEYKQALFYKHMRDWTNSAGISCFYFEAFDEQWKDAQNPLGSENHFGLFNLQGQAKYALWNLVDEGKFKTLSRDGNPIIKTYGGSEKRLLDLVKAPPIK